MPRLTALTVGGWRGVHDGLVPLIAQVSCLQTLSLAGSAALSSDGITRLLPLATSLLRLDLSACRSVTSHGLYALTGACEGWEWG